ncbi:uncharacterized protein O3C94_018668 [Discoglossus pictus]
MDEVWIISLCLILFALFMFILSSKSKAKEEPESIKGAVSTTSCSSSYGGKRLEYSEEELDIMMERLTHLLFEPESKKKEVHQEKKKIAQERVTDGSHFRRDAENTNETQELLGKGPEHSQPAYQPSHHRVQERSAPPAVENIMDEIEQAVQETVEPDYYTRRRQQRGRQWSEITGKPETDSM